MYFHERLVDVLGHEDYNFAALMEMVDFVEEADENLHLVPVLFQLRHQFVDRYLHGPLLERK